MAKALVPELLELVNKVGDAFNLDHRLESEYGIVQALYGYVLCEAIYWTYGFREKNHVVWVQDVGRAIIRLSSTFPADIRPTADRVVALANYVQSQGSLLPAPIPKDKGVFMKELQIEHIYPSFEKLERDALVMADFIRGPAHTVWGEANRVTPQNPLFKAGGYRQPKPRRSGRSKRRYPKRRQRKTCRTAK
jgi:hypothetical protein